MKNNLKQIRKIKGITQQQLAEHLGVSKAMISMWENNPNEKIPQNRIKSISVILNIAENDLFARVLDIELIKKDKVIEELERFAKQYTDMDEVRKLQKISKLDKYQLLIQEQFDKMNNYPEKLERISRFSRILNNQKLENLFDKEIKEFGLERMIDKFLKINEEQDPIKLNILYMTLDYLTEIKEEEGYYWSVQNLISTDNEDFKTEFDELVDKMKLKKASN
ncbi:helix-turn-helix transcriptional regulator [Paenibacillus tundrae]|uniref:helix-turn-helix transcriptional regulator n=1 Tax=Paenibacillus tundrae TaxID=528187 RepID=UPI0030CDCECC